MDDAENMSKMYLLMYLCATLQNIVFKSYQKRRTVVVEEIILNAVGARLIHFKYIMCRMDICLLLDGSWQFHRTPTSSLLCTTH